MRRHAFLLVFALVALLSLRPQVADRIRAVALATVLPPLSVVGSRSSSNSDNGLELENHRLRQQVAFLSQLDRYQEVLSDQLDQLAGYVETDGLARRAKALAILVEQELGAVPARVVYRPTSSWNHALWIDVGERHQIIKGSAVVVGTSLVGLVDYVGKTRSRVRLITDSALHPAVRVVRGGLQDRELLMHIGSVQEGIVARGDLFTSDEAAQILMDNLEILKDRLDPESKGMFLAKGELCGAAQPQMRGAGTRLLGEGFNYDHTDSEGPARDLGTGSVVGSTQGPTPIIQQGDLLITSGLDGVLPEGLSVATVSEVHRLAEGAYCYSITAVPTAGDLNHILCVMVLAPQSR